jgi:hypothetical protein
MKRGDRSANDQNWKLEFPNRTGSTVDFIELSRKRIVFSEETFICYLIHTLIKTVAYLSILMHKVHRYAAYLEQWPYCDVINADVIIAKCRKGN